MKLKLVEKDSNISKKTLKKNVFVIDLNSWRLRGIKMTLNQYEKAIYL